MIVKIMQASSEVQKINLTMTENNKLSPKLDAPIEKVGKK